MNKKVGLDYFSLDVDFFMDEKIQFVSARFGTRGEAITLRLLCKIYRRGYYIDWNEDTALLFAKGVGDGCSHSCVNDVVMELVKRGFFDRDILDRFSVLTGRGVQKRYFGACEKAKRKGVLYNEDFMLVNPSDYPNITPCPQNSEFSSRNPESCPQNSEFSPQRKVKESKEKKKPFVGDAPTEVFDHEGIPYKCSKFLVDKILLLNPRAKVPRDSAGLYKWCVHIERLLRIDKKPPEELRDVLTFAVKDPFWQANILSTRAFREKYDTLFAKMKGGADANAGTNSGDGEKKPTLGIIV